MVWRYVRKLGLPVAMAFAVLVGPALAGDQASSTAVSFSRGPDAPFAGARLDGEFVAADERIYFLGFRAIGNGTDGSVWYYDTVSGTYTDTGVDMPLPVTNYGIAALNDENGMGLYIFGGRTDAGVIVKTVQVYYPATNTATALVSDPFPGTTPSECISLPAMGVAVVNNTAVVLGGSSFAANACVDDNSAQTWLFHPMETPGRLWTRGPDLNMARGYITPAVVGDTVYAIGGDTNEAGALVPHPIVEAWTFGGGSWDDAGVADLPQPCDESQAFGFATGELANTITLAGCGQWPNAVPDVLQYSTVGNSWSNVGRLNDNRRNHAGAVYGSPEDPRLFILGGYGEASSFIDPIATSEIGEASNAKAKKVRTRPARPGSGVPTS